MQMERTMTRRNFRNPLSLIVPALFVISIAAVAAPVPRAVQTAPANPTYSGEKEGNFVIPDFHFQSGETMPSLRLHFTTLGTPRRDASGRVTNAVLVMHGTGGSGRGFLSARFGGVLFGSGELLDAARYYIILPDDIGHGQSSKPSDDLRANFPHYTYTDMVHAEHELVTKELGVNHLRLVMGTSMGCMHSWMWVEMYPTFVDGALPLACLPEEIAGRNRIIRDMIVDAIRSDPGYDGGNYTTEPKEGLLTGEQFEWIMTSAPRWWRHEAPTGAASDAMLAKFRENVIARMDASHGPPRLDANDVIYQFEASRDYNPAPLLGTIQAQVLALNSADDFVNPPGLDIMPHDIQRVPHGRFVLLPVTDETRGHGTHSLPAIWKGYLAQLLASLPPE